MSDQQLRAKLSEALEFLNDKPAFGLRRDPRRTSYQLAGEIDALMAADAQPVPVKERTLEQIAETLGSVNSAPIRQAITTKYIGPSNTRGSRVKAKAAAGSVTLSWDGALNSESNHARAAAALALKFGWTGHWFGGGMPDDAGNVYVCVEVRHGMEPAFLI